MDMRVDLSNMSTPEVWTPLTGIYEFELDWSSEEASSECYITVANHPALATLHPFNRIRIVDLTRSPELVVFIGRINHVKPMFKGALASKSSRGYAFQLYVRDYMQALADNFVQADKMHETYAFRCAIDAAYVPVYETGASSDTPPGQEPSPALAIIRDLVTKTGIIPDVTPTVTAPLAIPTINLHRNYMNTPQQSVFQSVYELAAEHPWNTADPPSGVGYVFRVAPPGRMGNGAVFEFFQRGALEWDVTQTWGFQGVTAVNRIPIQTFTALQEGRSIYSRSRVMAKGISSFTAPSVSVPGMESTWNPDAGLFKVTRESTTNDEILTQLNELQTRARGKNPSDPDTKSFRGEKVGSITVLGIPTNAARVVPVAGDTITLDPPPPGLENPEDNNKYVISNWHFEWPNGFSTYQLNRRPKARSAGFNRDLMRRGLGLLSSLKDAFDSGWLDFSAVPGPDTVPADRRFIHRLGVIPRLVFVYVATTTDVTAAIALGQANQPTTAVLMQRAHYDPISSMFVGYEITGVTASFVQLNFYPWLAYSEAAISGGQGWLKQNENTSIRVFVVP